MFKILNAGELIEQDWSDSEDQPSIESLAYAYSIKQKKTF